MEFDGQPGRSAGTSSGPGERCAPTVPMDAVWRITTTDGKLNLRRLRVSETSGAVPIRVLHQFDTMPNPTEILASAIRQLHSGALARTEFFDQLERVVTASPNGAARLLEILSQEQARSPLPPEVYSEVQRRIERLAAARQQVGGDETYVQTRPSERAPAAPPPRPANANAPPDAGPERMKGVGDTLNGRFVLEECIGFGGMGTVYKALDLRKLEASDRKPYIAIKVLNVQFRGHPKSLVALQREARKAQALAHPNIVSVYDFDRDGAMVYLTMEYLSGKPLSHVLRAPGFKGMPPAEAMPIVMGMGKALAYAHERGFVHCDFKPANVILTDSGKVKVIDFGIARVFHKAEEEVDVTVFDPGTLGAMTPAYASPEMLEHREADPRDDIYALACITYELLTGRHPFDRMAATEARAAGMRPRRPPVLGNRQWRALKCALAFERTARTPSVERFLGEIAGTARRTPAARWLAAGLLAVVIGVIGVTVVRNYWPVTGPDLAPPAAPAPEQQQPAAAAPPVALPVPQAAPAPTAAAIAAVLARVPCSALFASMNGQELRVQGYLSKHFGATRLKDTLAATPGIARVNLEVQQVDEAKCAVISTLAPYWSAHRQAGGGATIRLASPAAAGAMLKEGDPLMIDVTTGGAESYVTVDYYALDGNTVHLLPNVRSRENRAPAHYTATIGSLGNWVIGKPFGTELVVLVTTPVQLFDSLRPEAESSAEYLRALDQQLALIGSRHGADKIGVDFIQITTRARKR
jgi:predicted Ser/Thr protein kinase